MLIILRRWSAFRGWRIITVKFIPQLIAAQEQGRIIELIFEAACGPRIW